MYYGDDVIEEVRARNDIINLIGNYVSLKRAGSSYKGLCPFHNEKTPSFHVSPDKQMYYCFGCHKGGNIFTFLQEYENMTFQESVEYLAERGGVTLPAREESAEAKKKAAVRDTIFKINSLAGQYYYSYLRDPKGKDGMEYLKQRGMSEEMMKKFAVGMAPRQGGLYRFLKSKGYQDDILKQTGLVGYRDTGEPYDAFWNRVMFPIVDRRNHVIGFGGRVMGQGEPKYLNTRDTMVFDKSRNLFGINYIHGKLSDGLILCEGYMDVIALHQAGFTNAVAALGTAFTPGHANLIRRLTDQVYVCFDSDSPGRQAAMKALPLLKNEGIRCRVIDLRPHKDPDEFIKALSPEDFSKRMKEARIAFFFETDVISEKYNMDNPEEKTLFMNEAADRVLTFDDEAERSNYIEAFSREYAVRSEDFRSLVVKRSARLAGREITGFHSEKPERGAPREDAVMKGQGILLTWLCENPEKLDRVSQYVSEEDFVDEPYHRVAVMVFDQIKTNGTVDAAGIVSMFEDVEEQSRVAGIFHREIRAEEQDRAISDIIRGIRKRSLDHRSANTTDINEVQKLLADKRKLEQLKIDL